MGRQKTVSDWTMLEAARAAIIEHGPQVSTTVIAERLGLSQSALFKRFGTKEELVTAALKIETPAWLGELDRGPDERPIKDQIRTLADRFCEQIETELPIVMALQQLGINPMKRIAEDEEHPSLEIHRAFVRWLERARAAGRIERFEPALVGTVLLAGLHRVSFSRHVGIAGMPFDDHEAFVEQLVELICYAIEPASAAPREVTP